MQYITTGFVLRNWFDVIIKTKKDATVRPPIDIVYPNVHSNDNKIYISHSSVFNTKIKNLNERQTPLLLKWKTGWNCEAPVGYDLLILPVMYHPTLDFTIPHGILDTRIRTQLNVQMAWHPSKHEVFIPAGTPLMQIIPLKREEIGYSIDRIENKNYLL
jgi:hypothetical protein